MTNILIEGNHMPTYEMIIRAFERFAGYLPIKIRPRLSRQVSSKDIQWCDIFICVRGDNPLSMYLCHIAKNNGCKVIIFLDDDLLSFKSEEHPIYDKLRKRSLTSIIKTSDIILTPSEYLGNKYSKEFGKNYSVIHTEIEIEDIKSNWTKCDKVRILYAAGHMYHFQKLILPVLNKLYEVYKESISLTLIGKKINLDGIKIPIKYVDLMPYTDYRKYMSEHSFDIGLAPLLETEMTKSKYFNKYLEYSTQGICGIYSDNLPYTIIVKNNENGILSKNNPDAWFDALCKLINNAELRARCVKKSQDDINKRFTSRSIVEKLDKDIPWISNFNKSVHHNYCLKLPSYPLFMIQEFLRRLLKHM